MKGGVCGKRPPPINIKKKIATSILLTQRRTLSLKRSPLNPPKGDFENPKFINQAF